MWKLTVRTDASMAHALRHYKGKCENTHGHNYGIELTVTGDTVQEGTELLMDFSVLKKMLNEVLKEYDHKLINDVPPFNTMNPSSENIARFLFYEIKPRLAQLPENTNHVRLQSVTVSEKATQSATYQED